MNETDHITLYYRDDHSDKVYSTRIEPAGSDFVVNFAFGRRGSTMQTGSKTPSPVPYAEARRIYKKLVREKMAKGYTPGEEGTPYQATPHQTRATGITPQLLNPITEEELEPYLTDSRWWMQEKLDGQRILIAKDQGQITAINRRGLNIGLSRPIVQAGTELEVGRCLLDGECMGDIYHAFDLLEREGADNRLQGYATRYSQLVDLVDGVRSDALRWVPIAATAPEKRSMLKRLKKQNKEGLVLKDQEAPLHARPAQPRRPSAQVQVLRDRQLHRLGHQRLSTQRDADAA